MTDSFTFTITDVARFLGKSPVTLRGWENQGWIFFPRDENGDRKFDSQGVLDIAEIAWEEGRINDYRIGLIRDAIRYIQVIERQNEDRTTRRTRSREN